MFDNPVYRDGTAKGGETIGPGVDYKRSDGTLKFKHGETSQKISVDVNKETKVCTDNQFDINLILTWKSC